MKIAVLCDPRWRDANWVAFYVAKLADKYPDAIVISAGIGQATYTAERTALSRGMRVAALRVESPQPSVQTERPPENDEPVKPKPPPERYVVLYELSPKVPEHHEQLWTSNGHRVGTCRGDDVAREKAVTVAAKTADNVIVFTEDPEWPQIEGVDVHRVGVKA